MFLIALSTVLVMLFYAIPGFLMVKTKLIPEAGISNFAKLLMYVCQPALIIYSFMQVDFSFDLLLDMLFVFFLEAPAGLYKPILFFTVTIINLG